MDGFAAIAEQQRQEAIQGFLPGWMRGDRTRAVRRSDGRYRLSFPCGCKNGSTVQVGPVRVRRPTDGADAEPHEAHVLGPALAKCAALNHGLGVCHGAGDDSDAAAC